MSEATVETTVEQTVVTEEPTVAPPAKTPKKSSPGPKTKKKAEKRPGTKSNSKSTSNSKSASKSASKKGASKSVKVEATTVKPKAESKPKGKPKKAAKKSAPKAESKSTSKKTTKVVVSEEARRSANRDAAVSIGMVAATAVILKKNAARIARQVRKARAALKRGWRGGWRGFLSGWRWLRSKASLAAKRAWSAAKRLAGQGKDLAVAGKNLIAKGARASANAVATTAVGTWQFTAPFRHWVATPFRLALGTTGGLSLLLIFGTGTVLLLTAPWVGYLLWSGRLVMRRRGERVIVVRDSESTKAEKAAKAKKTMAAKAEKARAKKIAAAKAELKAMQAKDEAKQARAYAKDQAKRAELAATAVRLAAEQAGNGVADVEEEAAEVEDLVEEDDEAEADEYEYRRPFVPTAKSVEYLTGLDNRRRELMIQAVTETKDRNKRSELAGASYAFERVLGASQRGANMMARQYRASIIASYGPEGWNGIYTLGGVKRGIQKGLVATKKLLEEVEAKYAEIDTDDTEKVAVEESAPPLPGVASMDSAGV